MDSIILNGGDEKRIFLTCLVSVLVLFGCLFL